MPTALAEWTTERPDEPGFYWWRLSPETAAEVVWLNRWTGSTGSWEWFVHGQDYREDEASAPRSLWWPIRLDPPPVG